MITAVMPRQATFWFAAWIVWFGVLWYLSSGPVHMPGGPELPYFDKVCHFGYFFGGAGLLSAALYRRANEAPSWKTILLIVLIVQAATGALDEWHQSWVPERSGLDPGDWTADILGSLCGFLVFRRVHRVLA